jgi:DNA invertase Pin-like site-specific DNA recombinase
VAYYRVSDVKQGESGLGLEAQRASVARYLAGVKGTLIEEFTEIESGKDHKNRPQLALAIAAAKRHRATLVIAKLDRLARKVHFISGLMESAADFVACDMPHANKLTIHIMAAMAEHEREMISQRTVAALEQVKARGVALGNPRWQESIGKALAARWPKRAASQVDAVMHGMHAQGKSLRAIAGALNELGLTTPSGAAWYASSVRAALKTAECPEKPKLSGPGSFRVGGN